MRSLTVIVAAGLLILALAAPEMSGQPPADFSLAAYAGSYAPWGVNQYLTIDSLGQVAFYEAEVDSPYDVDSLFGTLSSLEMEELYDTITAVGFFGLDSLYDSGAVDGSGITLEVNASATSYSVQAANIAVSEVNRIVWTLNGMLAPFGIELNYGEDEWSPPVKEGR